ncbi:hypothetical protein LCGC14_1849830 [marine sediment metagenome]|uniref:Methyl-accepting transducer domain-containing protein n=1 Tax=marine sediment metagenome TaxID=412755 RepID=A0A0F9IQ81_9ZZZZ
MKIIEAMDHIHQIDHSASAIKGAADSTKSSWGEGRTDELLQALRVISDHSELLKESAEALTAEVVG